MFLMNTRITKYMENKRFDEDLFQTYFSKIYKSLVHMENGFISQLKESEKSSFVKYSTSLCDMARFFKISREKEPPSISQPSIPDSVGSRYQSSSASNVKRRIQEA